MKQIALSGTVLLQPQFSFPHQGIPDAKKRPERRVKSGLSPLIISTRSPESLCQSFICVVLPVPLGAAKAMPCPSKEIRAA